MKLHSPMIASVMTAVFCIAAAGQQPEEAPPISMGIVLDTSGSMGTRLALARQLVSELLKSASSLDEFALIQASDRPVVLSGFVRDRKSTRLNSSHIQKSRMPSSA